MKNVIFAQTGLAIFLALATPGIPAALGQGSNYKEQANPLPGGVGLPPSGNTKGIPAISPGNNGIIFPAAPVIPSPAPAPIVNGATKPLPSSNTLPPVLVAPASPIPPATTPNTGRSQFTPQPNYVPNAASAPRQNTGNQKYSTMRPVPQSQNRTGLGSRLFRGPIAQRIARFFSGRPSAPQRQPYTKPNVSPRPSSPYKTRAKVTWLSSGYRNGQKPAQQQRYAPQTREPMVGNPKRSRPIQQQTTPSLQQLHRKLQGVAGNAGRVVAVRQLPDGKIDIQLQAPSEKAAEQLFDRVAGNADVDPARLQISIDVRP